MENITKYNVKRNWKRMAIMSGIVAGCLTTVGTNWLIPGVLMWGCSNLTFKQSFRLSWNGLKDRFDMWRYRRW